MTAQEKFAKLIIVFNKLLAISTAAAALWDCKSVAESCFGFVASASVYTRHQISANFWNIIFKNFNDSVIHAAVSSVCMFVEFSRYLLNWLQWIFF